MIVAVPITPAILEGLLDEMLVISFEYTESEGRVVLVTDLWDRSVGSDRDFVRVVCSKVRDFTRYPGGGKGSGSSFIHRYNSRDHVGSFVIQVADLTGQEGDWQLHLNFGYTAGAVHLRCGHVAVARRGTVARRDESGGYQYFSLDGHPLDFHAPFGDSTCSP